MARQTENFTLRLDTDLLRLARATAKAQGVKLTHVVQSAFAKLVYSKSADRRRPRPRRPKTSRLLK